MTTEFHTPDGRVFHRLADIPYTRLDGTQVQIAVWHSACAVCGVPFFIQTPVSGVGKDFGKKHCDAHKLSKAEVSKRWGAAVKAARLKKSAG